MPNLDLHTDLHLLRRVADGDEDAFTILFHRYRLPFFSYALKITKTVPAAEELVQDTFLRIWLYRDRLAAAENAGQYLHGMLRNAGIDWLRKLAMDRQLQKIVAGSLAAGVETTREDVELGETRRLIAEAVDRLPGQQRLVFQLSRQEGCSYQEIADRLGVSPHTVRNHLVTALRAIREYLSREYGGPLALVICFFLERH